jgi:hypothetical protein
MIARKNPVKAPRNASVIERLLKVRSPLAGQKESGICHGYRPENYANREHGGSPLDEQILPQFALAE